MRGWCHLPAARATGRNVVDHRLTRYCPNVRQVFYVQLLFSKQVRGTDGDGWATVALADDPPAAFRRAARAYGDFEHPSVGRPTGVRVVDERAIRRASGEDGVHQAEGSLLIMAELFANTV
jgi:hypothetical protein